MVRVVVVVKGGYPTTASLATSQCYLSKARQPPVLQRRSYCTHCPILASATLSRTTAYNGVTRVTRVLPR